MKIIFVSFDEEGWECLSEVLKLNGNIVAIFTLMDELRTKMAGNKPFDDLSEKYNIPLHKIRNINDESTLEIIKEIDPDMAFVIGWSQLVKKEFIDICKNNCIGIHPTLLPKHRGRAPIPWSIIFGLKKTGVTMFYIDLEADNGDIIGQVEVDIEKDDDAGSLYAKVLDAHIDLMRTFFPMLAENKAPRIKQSEKRASNWPKRVPADGIIDWHTCSKNLYDWIRALTKPYPGAFTFHNDRKIIIWKSIVVDTPINDYPSGKIVDIDEEGVSVIAGGEALKITDIELEDGKRFVGGDIAKENIFRIGQRLG